MKLYLIIKLKEILKISLFILFLCFLLMLPQNSFSSVSSSLEIFFKNVFPSLFPFILLTEIVLKTDVVNIISEKIGKFLSPIFCVKKESALAIITGFLCGFPMGAKSVNTLYLSGKISKKDAFYLLKFVNNCNPAFILSTIGIALFSNIKIGFLLLSSHYISAMLIGIFSNHLDDILIIHEKTRKLKCLSLKTSNLDKNKYTDNNKYIENRNFIEILKACILSTFKTLGLILGFIIVFNLIFSLINIFLTYLNATYEIKAIILSILEMTSGSKNIAFSNLPLTLKICLVSFALGFSSFSIIFQIYSSYTFTDDFSFCKLVKFKFVHGILSFVVSYILINIKNILLENIINFLLIAVFLLIIFVLVHIITKKTNKIKQ